MSNFHAVAASNRHDHRDHHNDRNDNGNGGDDDDGDDDDDDDDDDECARFTSTRKSRNDHMLMCSWSTL